MSTTSETLFSSTSTINSNRTTLSENFRWNIVNSYIKEKTLVSHQVATFNDFLLHGIQRTIEESDIKVNHKDYTYHVTFEEVTIPSPIIVEEDRSVRKMFPMEARQRDLTYDSPIFANIIERYQANGQEPEIMKHRVIIGRTPIMLRSERCNLHGCSKQEMINHGECDWDQGGYFIIKGKERVLIGQIRSIYNQPIVLHQKATDKFKYVCEVRSMSEETGHSVAVTVKLGQDNRAVVFTLPYVKEAIPVGVLFKAMGFLKDEEIVDIIGNTDDNREINRIIKYILRDSFFTPTQNDALKHISQFIVHVLKDEKHLDYTSQVVENELLPHMGIFATIKEKAIFLGSMVNKLLRTAVGIRKEDDRDNYANKRVEMAGVLCSDLLRTLFKRLVKTIEIQLVKKKQRPDIVSMITRCNTITSGLRQCFASGNWSASKTTYVRTGVSQVLSRLAFGATLSHLRRITIPIGREGKNAKIRQLHPSQIMYICPVECFDPLTRVLMWDGKIKFAKEISIGDLLIDDKGKPTRVKSLCSGISPMYEIRNDKGDFINYKVTSNHILTLKVIKPYFVLYKNDKYLVQYFDRNIMNYISEYFNYKLDAIKFIGSIEIVDIIDISVQDYLSLPESTKDILVAFKSSCIDWEYNKDIFISTSVVFRFGEWLALNDSQNYNLLSNFFDVFQEVTNENRYIPHALIVNHRNIRLSILLGFIQSGSIYINIVSIKDAKIYISKTFFPTKLMASIKFLCRSLGIDCIETKSFIIIKSNLSNLNFIGNNPISISYSSYNIKPATSYFSIEPVGTGNFVGWQLQGTGRFLLSDFTVTHNTPEGQAVGIVMNLALLTSVTKRIPTVVVKEIIEKCDNIIFINDYEGTNNQPKIFLNGILMGITVNPELFMEELKSYRNTGLLDHQISFTFDTFDNEIRIFCDEGRFTRPLLTLNDKGRLNMSEEDSLDWDTMVEKQHIQFVDNSEIQNSIIAMTEKDLYQYKNDFCEIAPATMMGVLGCAIPFSDHNQCIHKDELVNMANGGKIPISFVKVGDQVITFNPVSLNHSIATVTHTYINRTQKQLYEIVTISGRKIKATYDHQFMTNQGWLRIEEIIDKCNKDQSGNNGPKLAISLEPEHVSTFCNYTLEEEKDSLKQVLSYIYSKSTLTRIVLRAKETILPIISRIIGYLFLADIYISDEGLNYFVIEFNSLVDFNKFEQDVNFLQLNFTSLTFKSNTTSSFRIYIEGDLVDFIKISSANKFQVPIWILNGSNAMKREFLAGFHNSLFGGINQNIDDRNNEWSLNNNLAMFGNQILGMFTDLDIEATKQIEFFPNNLKLIFSVSKSQTNMSKYSQFIGFRYNYKKQIDWGLWTEYLKFHQTIKTEFTREIDYNAWKQLVTIKDTTLFIPVSDITPCSEDIICDITVDSSNQSFVCGDSFCVHNSPRNIYQSSMGKQALGFYASNHLHRTDTVSHVLDYPQKPLVSTIPAELMGFHDMPSGINAIVAIACYTGFNQEDSILMNSSSVDRGLFVATSYRTLVEEEKKQGTYNYETICLPPFDKRKKNANYSFLNEKGIVNTRMNGKCVFVEKGDVIIGKTLTKSNKNGEEEIFDASYVIKSGEEGFIDRIIETVTPNGYKMIKVTIRNRRIPEIGDKHASMNAQKGTIGLLVRQEDMPFTADGITPDILINAHCKYIIYIYI